MSLQERFEGSEWGRAVISAFIGLTLVTVLVMQLPDSDLRIKAGRLADPYARATGLDQNWAIFAPDPRRISIDLQGRITYADGSRRVWHVPRSNDFVGVYWDYRWLKYMEHLINDSSSDLWLPLGLWLAHKERSTSPIVRIDLVRRWYDLLPPGGQGSLRSPWHEYRFYTVPKALLRRESR